MSNVRPAPLWLTPEIVRSVSRPTIISPARVRALLRAGKTCAEIGEELGCSAQRIRCLRDRINEKPQTVVVRKAPSVVAGATQNREDDRKGSAKLLAAIQLHHPGRCEL